MSDRRRYRSSVSIRLRAAHIIIAVVLAGASTLAWTLGARALFLSQPEIDHLAECVGYMLTDPDKHRELCSPYQGPDDTGSLVTGGDGAPPPPTTTTTIVMPPAENGTTSTVVVPPPDEETTTSTIDECPPDECCPDNECEE